MAEKMTLMQAVRAHLMVSPENERAREMLTEWKKLTDKDKDDLRIQFEKEFGYEIVTKLGA